MRFQGEVEGRNKREQEVQGGAGDVQDELLVGGLLHMAGEAEQEVQQHRVSRPVRREKGLNLWSLNFKKKQQN